jgi:hypothetical protein
LTEDLFELAVEHLVEALEAALGAELAFIEARAVDDFFNR